MVHMVLIYEDEGVSIEEYKAAMRSLSPKAKELLFALYDNADDHSASDEELADRMGYDDPLSARMQIGRVGQSIAKLLNKVPKNNYSKGKAWFHFVGGKYWNEKPSRKKDERWEMNENLAKAIEEFRSKAT